MTVQDLTRLVPGLQATAQGDHGVVTLTMRGIGNDSAKTEYADPEVALFVNGIYSPRAEGAAALSARLTSLAAEVKAWTPAARPDEHRRQQVVQDLRETILAAKPFCG